jgi:hypothetical protein
MLVSEKFIFIAKIDKVDSDKPLLFPPRIAWKKKNSLFPLSPVYARSA